jgi:hypothetical protein
MIQLVCNIILSVLFLLDLELNTQKNSLLKIGTITK